MRPVQFLEQVAKGAVGSIHVQGNAPPVDIPPGHTGPVVLPGSGRTVWWTGRVAIGLRHQPQRQFGAMSQSASWIQAVLLGGRRRLLTGV